MDRRGEIRENLPMFQHPKILLLEVWGMCWLEYFQAVFEGVHE